ncbi:hypothetical protein BRAO375_1450006 [Bradyrhizobium sp. ORS 375]|nr:hypothetical protein BRAO375_1450006 [Bradyrhizobium sp. ORS 375]
MWLRSNLQLSYSVMPGLVPGIHAVLSMLNDVDGRDKPGHDEVERDESKTPIFMRHPCRLSRPCPLWLPRAASLPFFKLRRD